VSDGIPEEVIIRPAAEAVITNVFRGESGGNKGGGNRSGEVFIDQEPGRLRDRTDLLPGHRMSSVGQRGEDILSHGTVLLGNRFGDHASGQLTEHNIDPVRVCLRSRACQSRHVRQPGFVGPTGSS
jgi:hypothetical protein